MDLKVVPPIDNETSERMRSCMKAEFPICLDKALYEMFGANGKQKLDSILKRDKFEKNLVSSPKDIWNLYATHVEGFADKLGTDTAELIRFESLKQMESMLCTKCPLYETELEKLKISGKS